MGPAFVVAAAVIWGSIGVAGRIAFRVGISPLEASFCRAAIAFVALLGWMLAMNRPALRVRIHDVGLFAAFGFVSIAVFFFAYLFAISQTTVATAAILLYTAPAFVILISAIVFQEPVTPTKAGALVLAFVGCALVVGAYRVESMRFSLSGVLAGLVSGFT
ncbi:MAG TPA: DMT family transporter, partial [bacterium]|nr:DMT family transporter [bacterium]